LTAAGASPMIERSRSPCAPEETMPTSITVGRLLSTSLAVFLRSLGPMAVLSIVLFGPVGLLSGMSLTATGETTLSGMAVVAMIASFFATYLAQGVITRGAYGVLRGGPFPLDRAVSAALTRLPVLILLALAMSVMLMAGYMLLIVPGIMLQCALFVAVPVLMVEGGGVGTVVQRSFDLTAGYRLRIFGLYLLMILIVQLPAGILGFVLQFTLMDTSPMVAQILVTIINGLAGLGMAVAMVVTYYRLREDSEGVGLDELEEVFA
jgi:hypothetical protein